MAAERVNTANKTAPSETFETWVHEVDQPSKNVKQAWDEQFAFISALGDAVDYDDPEMGGISVLGGKEAPELDNGKELKEVKQMADSGALQTALAHLSATHVPGTPAPKAIVAVAQLLCIMNQCVYMRDKEREEKAHKYMKPFKAEIEARMKDGKSLDQATLDAIEHVSKQSDNATKKIEEVAVTMGLNYVPFCNFSSGGTLMRNGPYAGAFYRKSADSKAKPFIVLVFKGTGKLSEWVTDAKIFLKSVLGMSPLRGKCHTGFFDGVYKEFPGDINDREAMRMILPFQMLRNQLWRLAERLADGESDPAVQVWVSGHSLGGAYATNCWQGLLAVKDRNKHTNRTLRDLVTFGSPRVGNRDYATLPLRLSTIEKSWRFVNGKDGVTGLPYISYYHLDSQVNVNTRTISMGSSELHSVQKSMNEREGTPAGKIPIPIPWLDDHSIDAYWKSLTSAKIPERWR